MSEILLIDADSRIPNIALGKLSTFHKQNGDAVSYYKCEIPYFPRYNKKDTFPPISQYDKAYCSIVFTSSNGYVKGKGIEFGGAGYSLAKTLPNNIEDLDVDYSLWPNNKTSYGFITRGCIRNCSFCVVPEKEGRIHQVNNVEDVIKHDQVKFLDNNILSLPTHTEVLQKLVDMGIKCQFNQGLDIRLVDKCNTNLLQKLNYWGEYTFAFDDIQLMDLIERKLNLLNWRKPWQLRFFVFIHPDMSLSNIVTRILWLKNRRCLSYAMRHLSCWGAPYEKFYTDIAAWANQPGLFKNLSFEQFLSKRHTSSERIDYCLSLFRKASENV